jgi:hypothetical protein
VSLDVVVIVGIPMFWKAQIIALNAASKLQTCLNVKGKGGYTLKTYDKD